MVFKLQWGGFEAAPVQRVVQDRDDHQRQQRGHEDAEQQRDGQAVEDGVVEDEHRAGHRGQAGQRDGLGAHGGAADHGLLEGHAAGATCSSMKSTSRIELRTMMPASAIMPIIWWR
jgi:hypothetical protein